MVSKILREMYRSGFKKPQVVSNNSVNINYIQKVVQTESFACEITRNSFFTYSCRISSFENNGIMYTPGFKNHELYQITP